MGARPSSFKKSSGGFLNGVDATITGYRLTDEFLGEPFVPGKFKGQDGKLVERPHGLNAELSVRVDGADEDTLVPLKVSNKYDDFEISADERTLTMADGSDVNLSQSAAFQKFTHSLCNPAEGEGFPEDRFSEDNASANWEPMIGTRVRLVQRVDAARTKEFGKRKAKNGKEYDRQDLVVDQVYELPSVGGKKGAKAAPPAKGKPAPAVADADTDVSDDAVLALERYLKVAPAKTLAVSKLRMKVLTDPTFKDDTDLRDAVAAYLADTDNLSIIDAVTFNEKKQTVTLD